MNSIFMLVYTSKSSKPGDTSLTQEILKSSRANNLRDEITGFLVARKGYFLQLLEGPEEKVRACFERIKKDSRHSGVTLQGETSSNERMMPKWQMALISPSTHVSSTEGLLALFDLGRRHAPFSDPDSLLTLVQMFAKNSTPVE